MVGWRRDALLRAASKSILKCEPIPALLLTPLLSILARRALTATLFLLLLSALSFVLISAAPGDPLSEMMMDPRIRPETVERMRARHGLDRPVLSRYLTWLRDVMRGDLGISIRERIPVSDLIEARLATSLQLSGMAIGMAWLIAVPLGAWAAARKGSWFDRGLMAIAAAFMSAPRLLLAILALLAAVRTGLFPIGAAAGSTAHDLFLPVLVLAGPLAAVYLRQFRTGMIRALESDYVRTARAKGISPGRILLRHAAPNAIHSLITITGFGFAALAAGAVTVETVMNCPGLGQLAIQSVRGRDLPVLMGIVLVSAVLLLLGNFVADVVHRLLDPRMRDSR